MATKVVDAGSLKEGSFVVIEGTACKVVDAQTGKSGKHGHKKMRLVAVGLFTGRKYDVVMPAHDNVEVPIIEKRPAQVLSITGDMANIMDVESYETFDLKIPDELKDQVTEGCQVIYWDVLGEKVMKQLKMAAE